MNRIPHLLLLSFFATAIGSAEESQNPTFTRAEITQEAALEVVHAALATAQERNEVVAVAVCDLGGHLIAFARMDPAKPAVVQIAIDKAHTSAIYRATTGKLWRISQPGEPAFGLAALDRTITFQGGVPVVFEGAVIGGVGVSGAAAHVDEEIALAAIEKVFGPQPAHD